MQLAEAIKNFRALTEATRSIDVTAPVFPFGPQPFPSKPTPQQLTIAKMKWRPGGSPPPVQNTGSPSKERLGVRQRREYEHEWEVATHVDGAQWERRPLWTIDRLTSGSWGTMAEDVLTEFVTRRRSNGTLEYEPPVIRQLRQATDVARRGVRAAGRSAKRLGAHVGRKASRLARRIIYGKCTKDRGKTVFGRCIPWSDIESGKGYAHRSEDLQEAIRLFREAVTSASVGATTTSGMPVFARATRRREKCRKRGKESCDTDDWYGNALSQGV